MSRALHVKRILPRRALRKMSPYGTMLTQLSAPPTLAPARCRYVTRTSVGFADAGVLIFVLIVLLERGQWKRSDGSHKTDARVDDSRQANLGAATNVPRPNVDRPVCDRELVLCRRGVQDQLAQVIPHLRAFGRSLSGSRDLADDLVQETLLKLGGAERFQAGTNMRAWTFIILRNLFLSQMPGPVQASGMRSPHRGSSPRLRARQHVELATCSGR